MPRLTLIAAVARNGVIGDGARMPWHLPADLAYFKRTTMGHPMIMGRRTFETMGALPGRRSIVLTRDRRWRHPGVESVRSLDDALGLVLDAAEVFVVGGGEIYRLALPRADRLLVTEVDLEPEGDVTFPPIDPSTWERTWSERGDGMTWVEWRRVGIRGH